MVGFIRLIGGGERQQAAGYQADGRSAAEASAAPIGVTLRVTPIGAEFTRRPAEATDETV